MNQKHKRWLKFIVQLLVATVAIYFVIGEIDIAALKKVLFKSQPGWLLLGFVAFNISKIISAYRLNHFFRVTELRLSDLFNLELYYLGMLYNQFLPGGIGGDGYKVYFLNKHYQVKVKALITATLLDRLSGVVALGFLALTLSLFGSLPAQIIGGWYGLAVLAVLVYPVYYLMVHGFFKAFASISHLTNLQAILVQGFQLLSVYFILLSLGVEAHYIDYMTLFLVTSVAAALPASLPGGFGVREFVFAFGYGYFSIQQTESVALASLFFFITLLSSLVGLAFLKLKKDANTNS